MWWELCKVLHVVKSPTRSLAREHCCREVDKGPGCAGSTAFPLLYLACASAAAAHPSPGYLRAQLDPTWAVLRTAILRTMAGALAPKEAGMDFWTLPKVSAPYLWDKAPPRSCDCCPLCPGAGPYSWLPSAPLGSPRGPSPTSCTMAEGRALPASLLPVQTEAVRGVEQVLGDVAPRDVCQDVPRHHLHLWRMASHTTGA